MDLLFTQYASPFVLIDNYIQSNRFFDFVTSFVEKENERQLWDLYLHREYNVSFEEFKNLAMQKQASDEQVGTTITDSYQILQNFIPEERG